MLGCIIAPGIIPPGAPVRAASPEGMPKPGAASTLRSSSSMAAMPPPPAIIVTPSSPSPSVSRAITWEPLSDSSASASGMGVNWKSSSVFTERGGLAGGEGQHVVLAQFQRFVAAGTEVQRFFQRQPAVGRIDQRDAAVAADGDVAAGAAAAQHEVVVVEFLAGRSTAESPGRLGPTAAEATLLSSRVRS